MGLLGELLIRNDGVVRTPDVPRQADSAVFAVDVTRVFGSIAPEMTVAVEHRNSAQDSWATAGTFTNVTTEGLKNVTISSLREFVRLKFEITAGSTNAFMRFQILPPLWKS
jgi:hypothetical protein